MPLDLSQARLVKKPGTQQAQTRTLDLSQAKLLTPEQSATTPQGYPVEQTFYQPPVAGHREGLALGAKNTFGTTLGNLTQAAGMDVADARHAINTVNLKEYNDLARQMLKDGRIPESEMSATLQQIKANDKEILKQEALNYERFKSSRAAGDVWRNSAISPDQKKRLDEYRNSGLPAEILVSVEEAVGLMASGALIGAAGGMAAGPAGTLIAGWQAMAGPESVNFRNETMDALVRAGVDEGIANQFVRPYSQQYGQLSGIVEHLGNTLEIATAKLVPKAAMAALKKSGAFKLVAEKFFGGATEGLEEAIQTGLSNYLKRKMVSEMVEKYGDDIAKSVGQESVLEAGGKGALVGLVLQLFGLPASVAAQTKQSKQDSTAIETAKTAADRLNKPMSEALTRLETERPTEAILTDLEASGEAERVSQQDLVDMGLSNEEAKGYLMNRIKQGKPTNISGIGQELLKTEAPAQVEQPAPSAPAEPAAQNPVPVTHETRPATIVHNKTGKVVEGQFVSETTKSIVIEDATGSRKVYPKSQWGEQTAPVAADQSISATEPAPPQAGIKAPPAPEAVRELLPGQAPAEPQAQIEKGGVSFINDGTGETVSGTIIKETKASVVVQTEYGKRKLSKDVWVQEETAPVIAESATTKEPVKKTGKTQQWRKPAGDETNTQEQVGKARTLLSVVGIKPWSVDTGLMSKRDNNGRPSGELLGWYSAGSYYPKGWQKPKMAKLKNALRDLDAGKPLRLDQVQIIDEAAKTVDSDPKLYQYGGPATAEEYVDAEIQGNRVSPKPVNEQEIDTGDLVYVNGEWYRAENTPDGTELVDGKTIDLNHQQEVNVGALFKKEDGAPYQEALNRFREQESKNKKPESVTKSVSPKGQTEFIGQDEGGFKLVSDEVKKPVSKKAQDDLQEQMFSTAESRGRALDELDAKGVAELKRVAEREDVDLSLVKQDSASIRDAIRGKRNLKPVRPSAKEPWEMTLKEYETKFGKPSRGTTSYLENTQHKNAVGIAVNQGKPVPAEVLADYPEFQKEQKKTPVVKDSLITEPPVTTLTPEQAAEQGQPIKPTKGATFIRATTKDGKAKMVIPVKDADTLKGTPWASIEFGTKNTNGAFVEMGEKKGRAPSAGGDALAAGGGVGIDVFVPDPQSTPPAEMHLYERSQELVKKYGGDRKIMEGRNPRGTLGVSYTETGNIALNALNNIGVAAHETTHNLDRRIKFSEKITKVVGNSKSGNPIYDSSTKAERKDLTKIYVTYYPEGKKTHPLKKRVVEGFATFVQKYIEDPVTMRKAFPRLANMVIDPGGKYYDADIAGLVKEARAIVNEYHQLDPMMKIRARRTSLKRKIGDSFLTTKDRVETFMTDRIWPIEKLAKSAGVQMTEKDPSLDLREYERTGRIFGHNTQKGRGKKSTYLALRNGEYVELHDFNWSTVQGELSKAGTEEAFNDFLVARETAARYEDVKQLKQDMDDAKTELDNALLQIKNTGAYTGAIPLDELRADYVKAFRAHKEASSVLENDKIPEDVAKQAEAEARRDIPNIDRIEEMFDKLVRSDLDTLHEVGIIDDKSYAALSGKKGYVTKKRQIINDLIDPETGLLSSKSNLGGKRVSSLIRRRGSELAILDPVYESISNHNEILRKALRQHIYNKLGELADRVPDLIQKEKLVVKFDKETGMAEYPQEKDPNVIMARVNGKRVPYVMNKDIKKHLDAVLTPEAFDIAEQLLAGAARLFTKGTTSIYPAFMFSNIVVDQITATAQTRTEYMPVISQLQMMYKALSVSASQEAKFIREYMTMAGVTQTLTGWNQLSVEDARKAVSGEKSALEQIAGLYQSGENILGAPSQASEIFTRITEYVRSRFAGDSQFVALEKAGRVTAPFHHRGSFGGKNAGRALVRGVPYMNAGMQVIKEYAKSWTDERTKRVAAVTALVIAAKLAEIIPIILLASDDQKDKYKDLEADELAKYIFIPSRNGKDLVRYRIPEQMTGLATPINMALQNYWTDAGYGWSDFKDGSMAWIPDQFDVTEPTRMVLSWIPQIAKPSIETAMNVRTYPRPRPLEGQGVQYLPPSERAYRTTSEFSKTIGGVIGDLTGLSPIKIDALLEGYFGRGVKLFTKTGSEIDKLISPYAKESYFEAGRRIQNFYDKADMVGYILSAIEDGKTVRDDVDMKKLERQQEIIKDVKAGLKEYRDLSDEDTVEARIIRAKIIDGIDSLESDETYEAQFKKKPSKPPKVYF